LSSSNDRPQRHAQAAHQNVPTGGTGCRGVGVTLDYSERSVHDVERILGEIHDVERILGEIHEEYRRTKSEEGLQGLALEFGAYLVSVLEKHRGPVIWKRDHPDFGEDAFPLEWRGTTLFPVGWCLKRIVDGPGDDIVSKWKALILNRDGEPAGNGRRDTQPLQRTGTTRWFSWIKKLFGARPRALIGHALFRRGRPGSWREVHH
jgi:hypothetical protein